MTGSEYFVKYLYLPPVLNPMSYDGARVFASGWPRKWMSGGGYKVVGEAEEEGEHRGTSGYHKGNGMEEEERVSERGGNAG